MASEVQALVNYYARTRYPRHIQTVCAEVLKKRNNEPVLMFWRAYGLVMEGSYSEVKSHRCACSLSPHACGVNLKGGGQPRRDAAMRLWRGWFSLRTGRLPHCMHPRAAPAIGESIRGPEGREWMLPACADERGLRHLQALRDLGPLLGAREVELAVPALMVHAHKQCKVRLMATVPWPRPLDVALPPIHSWAVVCAGGG